MSERTVVEMHVDTFSEGDGFYVRTEIEARSVRISGPFPDLQSAQKAKSAQLAKREEVSVALRERLQQATGG
jgi:hypothetical protein